MFFSYSELGHILRQVADDTNDAADHDEVHAAAEVCKMLAGDEFNVDYIDRWVEEIARRMDIA